MEFKIQLADSDIYEILSLPIETIVTRKGENLKAIKFPVPSAIANGGIEAIKSFFGNKEKTSVICFLENEQNIGREYLDYTLVYTITLDEYGVYTITLVKETDIPAKLVALEEKVVEFAEASKALETIQSTLETSVQKVEELSKQTEATSKEVSDITEKIKDVDVNELSVEELKVYKITESKEKLADYLSTHFVTSTAHKGIEKEYSITSEKQSYLMSMIMMTQSIMEIREKQIVAAYASYENADTVSFDEYQEKVASGEISLELATFQPSWNARGEVCTYDWTLEELIVLGADIEAVVRPLVSAQQTMEAQIVSATTKEEILAINITFG